jgi:poly-gamma-glutamate synthesis protein (capsule biosynthesis protein)
MGYAADHYQPSLVELAQSGNFRAIAYWLNVSLLPHSVVAQVSAAQKLGCLKVLVEFHPIPNQDPRSQAFRKSMVRFICRHIWQLNSEVIDGVQVVAKYAEQPQVLWQQAVRVVSPARRERLLELSQAAGVPLSSPQSIKTRLKLVARQRIQFRAMRSLLLTGTTAAAFILGCWMGHSDAPDDQKNAFAKSRPDTIATALGKVKVEQLPGNPKTQGVSLVFGGDVALNDAYSNLVGDDRQWAFSALEEYRQADVAMVNLEAPFTTLEKPATDQATPTKMNPENVTVLKHGGVDLVNLANNRTMDYQSAGLQETLKTLEQAGIRAVGAGLDAKQARRPEIIDVKGQRIAYLGYHDADRDIAQATQAGLNLGSSARIAADIKAIRDQVDWVIVNYHWDGTLDQQASDRQVELARTTIDQGADLVVGHHAQMLQGAEVYKGRPIIYSLGSFIFGEQSSSDYDTAVLKVALNDRQMKVELLPVEVKGFQPRVVKGDRADVILQKIATASEQFKQPMQTSMVLDTRPASATPAVTPQPVESPIESPIESPVESPAPEAAPAAPEASEVPLSDPMPSPEASEAPLSEPPAIEPTEPPSLNSSPADAATPAVEPTPDSVPSELDSVPSPPPGDSQSESPKSHPWGNNPFLTDPHAQPSPGSATFGEPMVPQQPTPTISPDQRSDAAHPDARAMHSLEPIKRRYAAQPPGEMAPVSLAPNL